MSRPLLADPDLVNKLKNGQAAQIHRCVRCNKKCLGGADGPSGHPLHLRCAAGERSLSRRTLSFQRANGSKEKLCATPSYSAAKQATRNYWQTPSTTVCRRTPALISALPDPAALDADTLYVGFWTDKGTADAAILEFLEQLHGKKVFLFGTAGFGGSEGYFNKILKTVQKSLDRSNTLIGSFMCQGKMPLSVRQRYEAMKKQPTICRIWIC